MSRIRVAALHKRWMKDAKYRREYKALEEEFSIAAAYDRGPEPRRYDSTTGRAANEDDSGRSRQTGERGQQTVYANS